MKRTLSSVGSATLLLVSGAFSEETRPEHPSLLLNKEQFSELQDRAKSHPWKRMKPRALELFRGTAIDPEPSLWNLQSRIRVITSTGALAYVLYPEHRTEIVQKLTDTLLRWTELYAFNGLSGNGWVFAVPTGAAFFNSVLALDVIHDELSTPDLLRIERVLGQVADWYLVNNHQWVLNKWGVIGVWGLYVGDRDRIDLAKREYKKRIYQYVSPDGVFNNGFSYAWARLGGDEDAKTYFMDVLEFTGEETFYTDPRMVRFYEWLYSGAVTPSRRQVTFGDTDPTLGTADQVGVAASFRAHRFSQNAAAHAAWVANRPVPEARLLTYVLMDKRQAKPRVPEGGIWNDSFASFWSGTGDQTMMGALYSTRTKPVEDHAHKDTNALHLYANGENLIRNSGYAGWGRGVGNFTWNDINQKAFTSNTITIAGRDHRNRHGGGLQEALRSQGFDYASGFSGWTLPEGRQFRNLISVHKNDGVGGYFLVADQVTTFAPDKTIESYWHPNSRELEVEEDFRRYRFPIWEFSQVPSFLTIFLGTAPEVVETPVGVLVAKKTEHQVTHRYLAPIYRSDSVGRATILTVFVPHLSSDVDIEMSRSGGEAYDELELKFGEGVRDIVIAPKGDQEIAIGELRVQAELLAYRLGPGSTVLHYFAKKARKVLFGSGTGFEADRPVSFHIRGDRGAITSRSGATIRFAGLGERVVVLNGVVEPSEGGAYQIESGRHRIEFLEMGKLSRLGKWLRKALPFY